MAQAFELVLPNAIIGFLTTSEVNMSVLRVTMVALALSSAFALDIVSQTFDGKLTQKTSGPGIPSSIPSPNTTMAFALDMESVRFRVNEDVVVDMPQYHVKTEAHMSAIFDAAAKRYTMYTKSSTTTPSSPAPILNITCKVVEFPNLVAPAALQKCIKDVAALATPTRSVDGLKEFKLNIPMPQGNASVSEAFLTDDAFILKKIIADTQITSPQAIKSHVEVVDMDSKAGAPDSSFFAVPTEWGSCEKLALPAMPNINVPIVRAFLHCAGLGASQSSVMV